MNSFNISSEISVNLEALFAAARTGEVCVADKSEDRLIMPSMLQLCNELGSVALGKRDYKEARKQFRYMVKESQKHGEREQAGALNRLGIVCQKDSRYDEAQDAFSKCLDLTERIYGPTHPEVASALNNLAFVIWDGRGDKAKARPIFEKAVRLFEDAMPFSSEISAQQRQQYARTFQNFACLLEEVREFDEAERLYRKALDINVEAFGSCAPSVFKSVQFLSNFLEKRGRTQEAKDLSDKFWPHVHEFAKTLDDPEVKSLLRSINEE